MKMHFTSYAADLYISDAQKLLLDYGTRPNLAAPLAGVFDSQICDGKSYDWVDELLNLFRHSVTETVSEPGPREND